MLLTVVVRGAAAGLAGGAVMTAIEKAEAITGRPSSFVPGRTLAQLAGLPSPDRDDLARNLAMHFGTAATAGVLRGAMAAANLRGGTASFLHTWVRLAIDQTLENATGVGAPPPTWPRDELVIDIAHKAVYAFATGAIADALIEPAPGTSVKRPAQHLRVRGSPNAPGRVRRSTALGSPGQPRSQEAVMDEEQQDRFKEAVERKARAAEAASRETGEGAPGDESGGIEGDQESLRSPSQPQDTFSARGKNTRHGKVTADKWNQ
jgi:hypothetical protein